MMILVTSILTNEKENDNEHEQSHQNRIASPLHGF